jgi:tetratricopeptide (TPR) repeat protein
MFLKIGELDKAEEHLSKSEKLFNEANAKYEFIPLYLNLALLKTARKIRDIEQSPTEQLETQRKSLDDDVQTYMQAALEYSKQQGVKFREACCYFVHGKIYSANDDFKNAEENFKKAINMCEEMKDKKVLSDVFCDYAKLLKKGATAGVYPKNAADEYFARARQMYEELKSPNKVKECDSEQQEK